MRLHAALALTACLSSGALAIFADDAGHIDYHLALVGLPKREDTFFQQPYAGSKASLLYTLSDKQVIGAVNPKDGAIVWRHSLSTSPNGTHGILRSGEDQDTIITAVGDRITAWSASDGRLAWETRFSGATVEDLEILEQEDGNTVGDVKDAVVLLNDATQGVKRLDGKTGRIKWTYQDTSGNTPFQVSTSPTHVYYISLHTSMLGASTVHVTSLSPVTGKKVDQYTLNTGNDISSRDQILFAGANSASPLLAWTDKAHSALKVNIIGTKGVSTFAAPSKETVERIILHAPNRVNSVPHFLVEYQTKTGHSAEVFHVNLVKSTISKAYSLPNLAGRGIFTTSTTDANVYFTRITSEEVSVVSSRSHGILGRWPIKSSWTLAGAYPVHGVSEVAVRSGSAHAVRSAALFSNGQWALVRNGELTWTRPEFLSGVVSAAWADLPEEETLAHELEVEGHQNVVAAYIHRVKRHIRDLEYFPAWLQALPVRILGNLVGNPSEPISGDIIEHDSFGFHKLVIVATDTGRLAALDAGSSGKIVWNIDLHQLSPGTTFEHPTLKTSRGYVELSDKGLVAPLLINVTTAGLLSAKEKAESVPVVRGQTLVFFDIVDGELKGFEGAQTNATPVWTFTPPTNERIVGWTARPLDDPVASIGKVLGDRRVLYKYLNPNLVLITTVSDSTRTASVYLLDSASGNLLHSTSHSGVDITRPIPSAISENWFSYSMTLDAAHNTASRGYELVVSELFESSIPDDRGPLGAAENSSAVGPNKGDALEPYVLSQTYHIPEEISHMTVSQTRQGITSRELLVTLPESNSIVGIPRYVIDPRRPIGRDPTAEEAAEGLTKYHPVIMFQPQWHINHKNEVFGVKDVITSPSLLESTSLVFAYGLDVFGTRLSPSFAFDMLGKGFNKVQMLLTVGALGVGVLFVAPLVRRKQINSLWTIP
ncbi:DUF1620-domain-containing protein [Delitschia confertaspora ATCC 74209]|uniref:ER membrane protein complex subunit 1 n=1 Tax=Delitschia confertaspora ATCC 74209 TaxID=1513339 RepID=A0A9P4JKE6_9PLEO|nr:DUF1620-domain-containing protein [Delitschia confertaspora ATCC 74209]